MAAVGVKELRGRMRGKRAFVILTINLLLVAGFAWMIESIAERNLAGGFGGSGFSASSEIGRQLFLAIMFLLTLITLILAPASTAGAISLEREKQTLDLLATTPISSLAIMLGKLSQRAVVDPAAARGLDPDRRARVHVRRRRPRRRAAGVRDPAGHGVRLRRDRAVRVRARQAHPGGDGDQPRRR